MKDFKNLLALLIFIPGLAFAQEKVERTFSGIEEIDISVGPGDAIFEKSKDNQVYLTLEHTIEDYNPTIEQNGNKLDIKEDRRKNGRWSGKAVWKFQIPDNIEIRFNTGSGDTEISGVAVEAKINSGSGDLDFSNISGEIKGNTGSGDISFKDSKGEFKMNTGSGDVEARQISGEFNFNTGSGDVQLQSLTLEGPSRFNSGSGDVEISLAGPLDHDISANSGSGDAVIDFNGNKVEGVIVMQANKRNGRIEAPFDFDEEEEIDNGGRNNITIKKTVKIGDKDVRINVSSGSGTAEIEK